MPKPNRDLFGTAYPISCLDGTAAAAFRTVLGFHLEGDRVLDPTHGDAISWKGAPFPAGLVASDIKTGTDLFMIVASHPEWRGWFDVVFYDPPYLLDVADDETDDKRADAYGGYAHNEMDLLRYMLFVRDARALLRVGGKLIVKCQDQYVVATRRLWLHHLNWCAKIQDAGLSLVDFYVYRYNRTSPTAFQVKERPCAVIAHTYFIVAERTEGSVRSE